MLAAPKSIICIKNGLSFFNESHYGQVSSFKKYFAVKKEEAQKVVALYGLSLDSVLPLAPGEKNQLFRDEIRPRLKAATEIIKNWDLAKKLGLSPDASSEELKRLIDEIKKKKAEKKKLQKMKAESERAAFEERERRRLGLSREADLALAASLCERSAIAITAVSRLSRVHLYFKVWVLSDNKRWYKVGITNNLSRRDSEQNVLPVPAETIKTISFPNQEIAASVEKVFHDTLSHLRIKRASNRELFALEPKHVSAIIDAMKKLERVPCV